MQPQDAFVHQVQMIVNLLFNPYIVAVDQEQSWAAFPNDIDEGPVHAMYIGKKLQWLWVEFNNDIHGSFDTPTQYEYNLVVTHLGICCIWFLLTVASGATRPRPWLMQIKYISPTHVRTITCTTTIHSLTKIAGSEYSECLANVPQIFSAILDSDL